MRGPYGFDMSDSCQNGKLKKAEFLLRAFTQSA